MGYPWQNPHKLPIRKKQNPEGVLVRQIIYYLKTLGCAVGKTKTQGVYDPKIKGRRFDPLTFRGFPDLTCFHNNQLYFIEAKSPKGIQSQEQKDFELLCNSIPANVHYILARKLEDITDVIKNSTRN